MTALYVGQVMHRRWLPRAYRFQYRVFSLLLDIDQLDATAASLRLFSRNRFNLISFHDSDHGACDAGQSLRAWAERLLAEYGIVLKGGPIQLLCFPRVLGYGFNPLSVWYCHHADGSLRAVILEVRNTFGEKHHYLLKPEPGTVERSTHEADKSFHVSPFVSMDGRYRFVVHVPTDRLMLRIEEYQSDQRMLLATWSGKRMPLRDRNLLGRALAVPFQGIKIILLIHWHGLRLWLRGFPFHRKPPPPEKEVTPAWVRKNTSRN